MKQGFELCKEPLGEIAVAMTGTVTEEKFPLIRWKRTRNSELSEEMQKMLDERDKKDSDQSPDVPLEGSAEKEEAKQFFGEAEGRRRCLGTTTSTEGAEEEDGGHEVVHETLVRQ